MSLITDPDFLSQGGLTDGATLDDLVVTNPGSGADITLSSAGANIPALSADDFIEIRGHSEADANGLYRVVTETTPNTTIEVDKVTGNVPASQGAEAVSWFGETADLKSVFFDTFASLLYLIEVDAPGANSPILLSSDGVTHQTVYSFTKEAWKLDDFLIKFPFPFVSITPEQFEIGSDGANANGWNWGEVLTGLSSPAVERIRTRKLLRTCGWSEIDVNGNTAAQYMCPITLGSFEDNVTDTAYFQLGTDTLVDDTVDFDFAGPVNEAIRTFQEFSNADIDTPTYVDGAGGDDTFTRGSGSFVDDGFKVGGQMTTRNSLTPANDGTFVITGVAALTLTFATATFDTGEADTTVVVAADNRNSVNLKLRVRDGDTNGKSFDSSNLPAIGLSLVTNKAERFPLANATDLKISATDATIDGSGPWNAMTITYNAAPQNRAGFVDASPTGTAAEDEGEFGIIIDGNSGTAEEIFEFVQRQLRKLTDIDDDGDVAIGRTMDELMRFVGDSLETGSKDGGLTFPVNPDGGGSGVFIDNRDTNDTNRMSFFDNFGNQRTFPFVAAGNINFNANLVNDSMPVFTMFYQFTTRTGLSDAAIVTPSGNVGDLESPGSNLPALSVNDFINVSGFANSENNGIYQVDVVNVSTQDYTVTKVDGQTLVAEAAATINVDENPIDSPDAIIVDSAASFSPIPITGAVTGSTIGFDFDYDGNVQGGRASGEDAEIIIRAIGLETAQFAEVTGTITRSVGQSFSLVASLERNYANP